MSNPESPDETADQEPTPFGQSMRRLFEAVDRFDADTQPRYSRETWDSETPNLLGAFAVMKLAATGARRHEIRRGQFGQAQYRLTEYANPDTKSQGKGRVIWLRTEPQAPRDPVVFQPEDLERRLGYREFDSHAVVSSLARRAISVDEINELTEEMNERGLESSSELDDALRRLASKYSFRGLTELDALLDNEVTFADLSQLITLLDDLDPELIHGVQSRLLARLLRTLVRHRDQPKHYSDIHPSQDNAAAILETSLRDGILSHQPILTDRVLTQPISYRYPFATDLLYNRLNDPQAKKVGPRRILGTERTLFVSDFMTCVLQGRMRTGSGDPEIRQRVEAYLRDARLMRYGTEPTTFTSIKAIATQNNPYPNVIDPREAGQDSLSGLVGVGAAFYEILQSLQPDDVEQANREDELDRKRGIIIDTILEPVIAQKTKAAEEDARRKSYRRYSASIQPDNQPQR